MGLLCLKVRSPEETRISQLCRTKCLIFCAYSPPLTSVHFKNIIFKGFVVTLQASINCNNFSALSGPQIFVHSDGAYIYSFTIFFFFFQRPAVSFTENRLWKGSWRSCHYRPANSVTRFWGFLATRKRLTALFYCRHNTVKPVPYEPHVVTQVPEFSSHI